ncbi:hypothetical protein D3C76_1581840 [compost metagenome]
MVVAIIGDLLGVISHQTQLNLGIGLQPVAKQVVDVEHVARAIVGVVVLRIDGEGRCNRDLPVRVGEPG